MKINPKIILGMASAASDEGVDIMVAGAVVINDGSILFIKRADHDSRGGKYELPSGKAELGETIQDTVERELAEETNFVVKEYFGIIESFDYTSKLGLRSRQFNFAVSVSNIDELILNPDEHSAFQWIKFDDIADSDILCELMKDISQQAVSLLKEIN